MNALTTDGFYAMRQPDGDVWITKTVRGCDYHFIIPKSDCTELAKLLMWPVVSESHKVDYAVGVNEPE